MPVATLDGHLQLQDALSLYCRVRVARGARCLKPALEGSRRFLVRMRTLGLLDLVRTSSSREGRQAA